MEYRIFRPGLDDSEVLRLRAAVWGKAHPHTDAAFFNWLYQQNPAGIGSGILMTDEGQTVGFAGLSPKKMECVGRTINVAHGLDYMVHPNIRSGAGSYRVASAWVMHAREAGFQAGMVFPNDASIKVLTSRKIGFKAVFSPMLMVRLVSGFTAPAVNSSRLRSLLAKAGGRTLATLNCLHAALRSVRDSDGHAFDIGEFDASFDEFWERARDQQGISILKNAAYLNWRYNNHPIYRYTKIGWRRASELCGFVILSRRNLMDMDTMMIVDILTRDKSPRSMCSLIAEAVTHARQQGCSVVATLAIGGSEQYMALKKMGFIAIPKRFDPKSFTLAAVDFNEKYSCAPIDKWRFDWGYMDVV